MLKTSIPFVDLRGKTPVDLLRTYPDKARDMVNSARGSFGVLGKLVSFFAIPLADRRARRWLARTSNPYRYEIESMADIYHGSGIYALNLSYEWACSSGVYRTGETVSMLRVLDWPFPNLGRNVVIALQKTNAGDYYNVTWPGASGVFNAMAPERFSAALNLAPMRKHGKSYFIDWVKNRRRASQEYGLPPAHLLRQAFEQCATYADAKKLLTQTPIAVPAIFILSGTNSGEGCIIERMENAAEVVELSAGQRVTAANHFTGSFAGFGKGWRPRALDSAGRLRQCESIAGHDLETDDFGWLHAPIVNSLTRLCMVADAATGRLLVQGYEGTVTSTNLFHLPGNHAHSRELEDAAWS